VKYFGAFCNVSDYPKSKMQKSLKKSPLKDKPLRNPGQSIQQENAFKNGREEQ
jgi:hypothetical protein